MQLKHLFSSRRARLVLTAIVALSSLAYNAVQTQEAILADVNSFLAGTAPQDDMTLVVLRAANA